MTMHNDPHDSMGAAGSSMIPLLMLLLLLVIYFAGIWRYRRSGKKWSSFRTICFVSGIILLVVALTPPLALYGHHDMRIHMIQHLLIGMLAPLGLVLGAPVTLALQLVSAKKGRIISSSLGSRPFHYLSHPITALILNIGGMYLLYLTPIYSKMQSNVWLHYMVHFHFLAAGYLFVWSIAGPDPAPKRPSLRIRLLVLFISMATHAYLSKLMYVYHFPQNTTHSTIEIEEGAKIMYYGGDLAEILLAIALFSVWYRSKSHSSRLIPMSRTM